MIFFSPILTLQLGQVWTTSLQPSQQKGIRQQPSESPMKNSLKHTSKMVMYYYFFRKSCFWACGFWRACKPFFTSRTSTRNPRGRGWGYCCNDPIVGFRNPLGLEKGSRTLLSLRQRGAKRTGRCNKTDNVLFKILNFFLILKYYSVRLCFSFIFFP